jgi:hypothetical protein
MKVNRATSSRNSSLLTILCSFLIILACWRYRMQNISVREAAASGRG